MKYTLTRIDPHAPNERYPIQQKETVSDPLEEQIQKTVFMGRLENMLHGAVNWGRKTPCGRTTSACRAAMWRWPRRLPPRMTLRVSAQK